MRKEQGFSRGPSSDPRLLDRECCGNDGDLGVRMIVMLEELFDHLSKITR